jgi:hypothetical protein
MPTRRDTLAKEAYIYAFAPLFAYNTWHKQAVDKNALEYIGGFNAFKHYAQAFTPDNKDIATPKNDTPYSTFSNEHEADTLSNAAVLGRGLSW